MIISMPDRRTSDGWRDYALLLFLYNCGARVSETAGLQWDDLHLVAPAAGSAAWQGRRTHTAAVAGDGQRPTIGFATHDARYRSALRVQQPPRSAADAGWHRVRACQACGSHSASEPQHCSAST